MTDNQWMPEPWRPGASRGRVITGSPGSSECGGRYLTLADIARACVCVNACKGIPTAALKAGAIDEMMKDMMAVDLAAAKSVTLNLACRFPGSDITEILALIEHRRLETRTP